jgi:hypothetical protein
VNGTRNPEYDAKAVPRGLSNGVALLLFLHWWLANSRLEVLQAGADVALGVVLLWLLYKSRLSPLELALLAVFGLSMVASWLANTAAVTLLGTKLFGLAILSLLVFSKLRFNTSVVIPIAVANLLLMLYQFAFGNPGWYAWMLSNFGGSWREWGESRALGLFMSTHASATLTAILFLWWSRGRALLAAAGLALLLTTLSIYVCAAYLAQVLWGFLERLRIEKPVAIAGAAIVILAFLNADAIINFDLASLSAYFGAREQGSFRIIAEQVFSLEGYREAFTWIPGDPSLLTDISITERANEIALLSVVHQGGIVLGVFYLWLLLWRTKVFWVFMAVSLLHYGMPTIPVIIFLLLQWNRDAVRERTPTLLQPLLAHARVR